MSYDRDHLEKLLLVIGELMEDPDNTWWVDLLQEKMDTTVQMISENRMGFNEFVKMQRKIFRTKSKEFYKDLLDKNLQSELERDYQEMLWWRMLNNVERQYLFACYQVENMLNYFILTTDAHTKVSREKNKYVIEFNEKYKVVACDYFFYEGKIRDVARISSMQAKVVYWAIETGNKGWYLDKPRQDTFDQLIKIRNRGSHRNAKESNEYLTNLIERYRSGDDSYQSYISAVLRKIRDSISSTSDKK